jgi:nicotinamidase-related amidase
LDWQPLCEAILGSEGELTPAQRSAIFAGEDPPELAPLLDKVRGHAYRIVDADVAGLETDVVVEAALAAALGVALRERLRALEVLA